MARLVSVNVGLPRDIEWRGRTVHTGIWKDPVPGRRRVGRLNVEGDGQGDLGGHGGEQRAVFVYQLESYRHWEQQLGRRDLVHGQFGENFTIDGLPDDEVCIGDRFRIGTCVFEVTQPRTTCYRVGIRLDEPRMAALLTGSGRPGFYFRVIQEGEVSAGDAIEQIARGAESMTVAEVNALLYSSRHPREQLERVLRIPALSPGWRASFEALLDSQRAHPGASGNAGLVPALGGADREPGVPVTPRLTHRSRVRRCHLAHAGAHRRAAADHSAARTVRGPPAAAGPEGLADLPQLLALGTRLRRTSPGEREARAERSRRHVPEQPRARG